MLQFMKNKILIPGLIIVALGVFFSFRYLEGDGDKSQTEDKTILQTVMVLRSARLRILRTLMRMMF